MSSFGGLDVDVDVDDGSGGMNTNIDFDEYSKKDVGAKFGKYLCFAEARAVVVAHP